MVDSMIFYRHSLAELWHLTRSIHARESACPKQTHTHTSEREEAKRFALMLPPVMGQAIFFSSMVMLINNRMKTTARDQ